MTAKENWLEKEFPKHQIRQGRTMEDPDFPRIAITYSLEENAENSSAQQDELAKLWPSIMRTMVLHGPCKTLSAITETSTIA